jgi:uncharacterized protein (DUF779 family)
MSEALKRVDATPLAREWLSKLKAVHGPLMIHQSGGCCDGSSPMCYPANDFKVGQADVFLGYIDQTPVYIGGDQFEYWRHTGIIIDVVKGRGSGFSLESPEGIRFLTRSHVFDEVEMATLAAKGEPLRGPQPQGSANPV